MADVVENLNTLHKEVYPEGVPDLVPNAVKLQKEIKFSSKELELGLKYVQPVRLAFPSGFTHALGDGTAGAFDLNDSIAGTQARAEVVGGQILLRDQMTYEDASKASKGKKSFVEGTSYFYEGMQKAMRKRLESTLMYGTGGTIAGASLAASGLGIGAVSSYSNPTITLTAASFASGLISGIEGTYVDIYYNNSGTTTKRGTKYIVSVNIENKTITLDSDLSGTTTGDVVFFKGAYGADSAGIHKVLTNAGTLFNISAATYSLWKSGSYAVSSAPLSFAAIKKAISASVNKGLDEDVMLMCNPGSWDDLVSDIVAVRRTDKSEVKKVEIGAEEVVYHSQNGMVRILPSIFCKQGFAYGICAPYWKRIGSTDVTFNTPGFGDQIFFQLQTKAGCEARCYTNQAIFSEAPAKSFIITGIVQST